MEWWLDTGVNRHISFDRKRSTSYEALTIGEQLYIGKSSTLRIEGKLAIVLRMILGMEVLSTMF